MNNFILEQNIIDISLCDDLINFHKNSELKCKGMLGSDDTLKVNPEKKISTDVILPNCEVSSRYIRELRNCVSQAGPHASELRQFGSSLSQAGTRSARSGLRPTSTTP